VCTIIILVCVYFTIAMYTIILVCKYFTIAVYTIILVCKYFTYNFQFASSYDPNIPPTSFFIQP